jgi:SAM-dependent methyltransferase
MKPSPHRNKPYRWLAEYYDDIFNLHHGWFDDARNKIAGQALSAAAAVCDLCCGTGRVAVQLALQGYRTYGVDGSRTMCRLAREKARSARAKVRIIYADMRDFKLPEPVDVILCEYDALNHIDRKEDLASVARCAAKALKPGGSFYFDVNNARAFKEIWGSTWMTDAPGAALIMHGGYRKEDGKGYIDVHWFLRQGQLWRRQHEYIEQVSWTQREMRSYLHSAGFTTVRAWDAKPFFKTDKHIKPGCRTFYLARKD